LNFELTVTNLNRAPLIVTHFPDNFSFNALASENLYFNISDYDPDGTTPDTYWYVDDVLKEYDNHSFFDEFIFNFGCGVSGEHYIKTKITDGELNNSMQWNVTLEGFVCSVGGGGAGGGGGGGGGGGPICIPLWACNSWEQCSLTQDALQSGELVGEDYRIVSQDCSLSNFGDDVCGYQERSCFDLADCNRTNNKPAGLQSCYYTVNPTCEDKIKNCHDGECEFLVDCGGPCGPCPTCSDGIQNQGEGAVDCGGPCPNICPIEIPQKSEGLSVFFSIFFVSLLVGLAYLAYRVFILGRSEKRKN
jgi:hypothetical protein